MLFLNSRRVSSRIVRYDTTVTLQLFKNSTDTQGKLRLNLHSLSVSESFRIQALDSVIPWAMSFPSQEHFHCFLDGDTSPGSVFDLVGHCEINKLWL
jgi:hypothetical protein